MLQKRHLLFLFGCIPTRMFFVYLYHALPPSWLPYFGYGLLLIALGFISIYLFDLRSTGIETQGQPIWWNALRVIHGISYLGAALYAIKQQPYGKYLLLKDTILGLIAFLIYHKFIPKLF